MRAGRTDVDSSRLRAGSSGHDRKATVQQALQTRGVGDNILRVDARCAQPDAVAAHARHGSRDGASPHPALDGLRYRVDRAPLPGLRRRADIVFGPAKVAVFVDGCFWHGCPEHGTTARANADHWSAKIERNRERDADTDARLADAGMDRRPRLGAHASGRGGDPRRESGGGEPHGVGVTACSSTGRVAEEHASRAERRAGVRHSGARES